MSEWHIHQDGNEDNPNINSYTITTNILNAGWRTDNGYDGYGLPKELAQWICDVLNKSNEECCYEMDEYGYWSKK